MHKKFMSVLLSFAVAASSIFAGTSVYAEPLTEEDAEYVVSVSLDKETLKAGDTVVATFSLEKNAGLIGLKFNVNFNEDVLQVYSEEAAKETSDGRYTHGEKNGEIFKDLVFTGLDNSKDILPSPFVLRWSDPLSESNITSVGILGTVTFVVKDDVKPGIYDDVISVSADKKDAITYLTEKDANGHSNAAIKDGSTTYFKSDVSVRFACTEHSWGEWKTTTEPTCTEDGEQERICNVCGETETETVDALGHDWSEWETTKDATCTEDGEQKRVCNRCDVSETKVIDALGHDWSEWETTKDATCTEDGEQKRVCNRCDVSETKVIDALGHDWSEWKVVKEPTETESGLEERECKRCGEKQENELPVNIDGTVYTDPETSVSIIAEEGEVPGSVHLNVEISDSSSDFEISYEITLTDDKGDSVQPTSEIYVKIPVPEGWDDVDIFVYYCDEDGHYIDMHAFVSAGYLYFTTTHFSEYVVTTEKKAIIGDVNSDGIVNEPDSVALARYLAQWNVTINESVADLDGNGRVEEIDNVILARRLAGWNV